MDKKPDTKQQISSLSEFLAPEAAEWDDFILSVMLDNATLNYVED